jgi:hypothetical protein
MPAAPHNTPAAIAQPGPAKTSLSALANVVLSLLATAGLCAAFLYWRASPSPNERLLAALAALSAMPAALHVLVALGELFAARPARRPVRRFGSHVTWLGRRGPRRRWAPWRRPALGRFVR